MNGWRARIGLIVPSANTVNEPEFYTHLPDGVSVHTARFHHETASVENQSRMASKLDRCVDVLTTADVDVIAFGCTSGSLVGGPGYEEEIEAQLRESAGGVPAVATAASVTRALDVLGVESLVVTTPYPAELDEREVTFLEGTGFDVLDIGGPELQSAVRKADLPDTSTYREARTLDQSDADGVFISCTNYQTFEIIERLEADLEKPVVTSNQATLWDALRTVGVDYADIPLGRLFDR